MRRLKNRVRNRRNTINEWYGDIMTVELLSDIDELIYYISYHGYDEYGDRYYRRFELMEDNKFSIETDAGMYLDDISFKEVKRFMQKHDNTMYFEEILDLKNFDEFVEWYIIKEYFREVAHRKKKPTLSFVKRNYPHLLKVVKKHLL